ncbi:hypothetical protein TBR22_A09480 [Luteitalea sp. TBR-22]|uniref:hypothetical protein n=1 Tax=Luteitalea sp. TBR-22 TaxID=2802971 RepID=UPI001AF43B9D|nr:hypothetical protein [Luteitalea sp. TBR-22]BCS31744.1 hypothetical protein TBR22_A09480 [Luteitalea sp. TBR-22]
MTRTPFFWFLIYVHTAFGAAVLGASIAAARARRGSAAHRRAGWWFVQAMAGLFVTTALMASIRYTFFLFVIGYAAWYASHQAWLGVAGREDRPYLAGPLATRVQHDLAVILGVALMASAVAMLVQRTWPITPYGLGLGVAFAWGGVLAGVGGLARAGRLDRLPRRSRHATLTTIAVTAAWSEFAADVTVHFVPATVVWLVAWVTPALLAAWRLHLRIDIPASLLACLRTGQAPTPAWPAARVSRP